VVSSFDTISREWLIRFVEHRIGDRRIIRLIQKWLKAGVLEDDQWIVSGTRGPRRSMRLLAAVEAYRHPKLAQGLDGCGNVAPGV
jgi:hypothetical protein